MNKKLLSLAFTLLAMCSQLCHADAEHVALSVWVNEAIVATYTYNYKSYLDDQKQIAKYYTASGWMAYSKALNDSKLPEAVQKNLYFVNAVSTEPPVITNIDPTHWKATMPLLVVYHNPQYKQQQTLKVSIYFETAPSGQGIRGLSISNLQSVVSKPPCQCPVEDETPAPTPPASASNAKK